MSERLFDLPDDRKPWQRSDYPPELYRGEPPSEPKDEAGTSVAAARSIRPQANTLRARVLAEIRGSWHGMTDDEIEVALHLSHQTVSARRRELVLLGDVVDSGVRRATRSGRKAAVWVNEGRRITS